MTFNRAEFRGLIKSICVGLFLAVGAAQLQAQVAPTMDRRPQATRAELEASLVEIEKIIASPAYSTEIKQQKQFEAAMIRQRLQEGDILVGDQLQITLSVPTSPGASPINGPFTIGPNQMLTLPDIPPIPMRGVLRSEVKDYLTEYLGRLFRDQTVQVVSTIRLTIVGGIGKPGFYQLPAEMPLPEAILAAGGPRDEKALDETTIRRSNEELWSEEEVANAIRDGLTLDQLNLRAGDELVVGQASHRNWFQTIRTYMLIPGLIISFVGLLRLVGVI
jgi:protein involved in polysaccharide export with SLBB domain